MHRPRASREARKRWNIERIALGMTASGRQWKRYYKRLRRAIAAGVRDMAAGQIRSVLLEGENNG